MPSKNKYKACPGCGKTILAVDGYCKRCKPKREQERIEYYRRKDKERPNSHRRGYNYWWRTESKKFLKDHPKCNICHKAESTCVDHIVPHRGNRELFRDKNNWQAACKKCHDAKTARGL